MCAHNVCIPNPSPAPKSQSGPNVGAIAGGVIGGVAFVLVMMYLLWRFWIKKIKAQRELYEGQWEDEEDVDDDISRVKSGGHFMMRQADAASTRTRKSVATSIMSRMSNVIHIAFVPGVTSRERSGHASLLADVPVPPIPAAYANPPSKSPLSHVGEEIRFGIEDLRGSTYSAASSRSGSYRDTQYTARQSIAPSITSEIYQDDATLDPLPATMGTRYSPRLVSIKSSQASSPTDSTISSNPSRLVIPGQGLSPYSRPQVPRSLSGGSIKLTQVNLKKGRFPIRQPSDASTADSSDRHHIPSVSSPLIEMSCDSESEEDEHARARRSLLKDTGSPNSSAAATPIIQPFESPFFDASEMPLSATPPPSVAVPTATPTNSGTHPHPYAVVSSTVTSGSSSPDHKRARRISERPMGGLSAVIEEATRRGSRVPSHDGMGGNPEIDSFGDTHAS